MVAEKPSWAEIIADLESKRAALDSLIGSFRAALSLGALGTLVDVDVAGLVGSQPYSGGAAGSPVELPRGAFLGKSLPAAIKLYLSAVKRKQTIREIATALRDGGVESTSDNFENIVTGALNRMKIAGDVLRFKDGWGLAEFYPEGLRNRITQDAKPKARRPTKAKAKRAPRGPKQAGPTIDSRIMDVLGSGPMTPHALTGRLEAKSNVIGLALGRLSHKHKVEKLADGRYARSESQPALRVV